MGWKRRLVELDRPRPVSDREHWGYRGLLIFDGLRFVAILRFLSAADPSLGYPEQVLPLHIKAKVTTRVIK